MLLFFALALLGQPVEPAYMEGLAVARRANCPEGSTCLAGLSARELIAVSEDMIAYKKYAEARQVLAALDSNPQVSIQRNFLQGYIARQTGDKKTAIKKFRAVLVEKPDETRVRVELARTLYENGSPAAADYHFKLAQRDTDNVPPDIQRAISRYRQQIRAQKGWSFSTSFGIAPDTNINSATNNTVVDIFGLPFALNDTARSKTGVGQTVGAQGQARLKLSPVYDLDIIGAANFTNYKGSQFDDIGATFSIGPARQIGQRARVGIGATYSQRWFGGDVLNRGYGVRLTGDYRFTDASDLSAELSVRKINSLMNDEYDGSQLAVAVSYQQAFARQITASFGTTIQRNKLADAGYSNWDMGLFAGLGAELPWGINAGLSAQVSNSLYDATDRLFFKTRKDLRINGRAYVGLRSLRVMGFSPSVEYTYQMNNSNISLYDYDRHRVEFAVARYF
jgi:outer membrane protein